MKTFKGEPLPMPPKDPKTIECKGGRHGACDGLYVEHTKAGNAWIVDEMPCACHCHVRPIPDPDQGETLYNDGM